MMARSDRVYGLSAGVCTGSIALALLVTAACGRTPLDPLDDGPVDAASVSVADSGASSFDAGVRDATGPKDGAAGLGDAPPVDATMPPDGPDAGGAHDAGCVPSAPRDGGRSDAGPRDSGTVASWAFGASGTVSAIATDADGNVFATGSSGPDTMFYLVKLDRHGAKLWEKTLGDLYIYGNDIAVDAAGNVIVVGDTGPGAIIDFGAGPVLPGSYVVKYDPSGALLSQMLFPQTSTSSVGITAVRLLSSGDLVIAGALRGTASFGGVSLTAPGNGSAFVARYDVCGALVFAKAFGGLYQASASGLLVDASDNLLLTGIFTGPIDFGGGTMTGAYSNWDTFVVKLDASGGFLANRQFFLVGTDGGPGRGDVDAAGNLVLPGFFDGALDFGGGKRTSAGKRDAYVVKLGPKLEYLWAKQFGDAEEQDALAAIYDSKGDIVLSGTAAGVVSFGTGDLRAPVGASPLFLAKLSPSGVGLSAHLATGVDDSSSAGVALLPTLADDVIVGGSYAGTLSFGPASFTSVDFGGRGVVMRVAP